jgi:hypothetical protein
MDAVDYIIHNSSEDDVLENVTKHARSIHGNEVVDSLIHNTDESLLPEEITKLARKPKETLESKYAEPVYGALGKVAGALQYAAKPYSVIASPALEAATEYAKTESSYPGEDIVRGVSAGARQLGKELTQFEPTPESSVAHQLRKLGIGQEAPVKSLPSQMEEQFPILSSKIKSTTYGDIGGFAADVALAHEMPSIPIGKATSAMAERLSKAASLNREKALTRISNVAGDIANEAVNKAKNQIIGNTLEKYGLSPLISDEVALKEAIGGKYEPRFNSLGEEIPVKVKSGLIDDLHDQAVSGGNFISNKISPINASTLADDVFNNLSNKYSDPSSGAKWSPSVSSELRQSIDNVIKPNQLQDRSFGDLVKLKKSVADMYYDRLNKPELYSAEGPMPKAIYKAIWDEIDNKISSLAQSDPDIKSFVQNNTDLSRMLDANNMLSGVKRESLKSLSLPEVAVGVGGGYLAGLPFGQGPAGAIVGGLYKGSGPLARAMEEKIPSYVARAQEAAASKLTPITSTSFPSISAGINIMTPDKKAALSEYKLPRTFDEFQKQLPMVKSKLEMVMGPDMAQKALSQVSSSPQEFFDKLPLLENELPGLFQYDRYRRVNGRIFDPTLKALAEKEILDSPMSNTEKMIKQSQLLQNGRYDGP